MKVEVMALGKGVSYEQVLEVLGAEGPYERHVAVEGMPLVGRGEAPTLVVDGLDAVAGANLDAMRLAVNRLEAQGYDRVVFIARLSKHEDFSKLDRRRIEAIERDVGIRKFFSRDKVHFEHSVFSPYIFVDTGFQRASQPIFVLAMLENRRRIGVERERCNDLDYVGRLAVAHYREQQGELMLWGPIQHYHYHDGRGKVYIAGPDGRFFESTGSGDCGEGRATLSVAMQL